MGNAVHWYFFLALWNLFIYDHTEIFEQMLDASVCFAEKYDYVGRLIRDGEQPTNYSDEEDDKDK